MKFPLALFFISLLSTMTMAIAHADCLAPSSPVNKDLPNIELTLWNVKQAEGILARPPELLNSQSDLYFFQEVNQVGLDLLQTEQGQRSFVQTLHNHKKYGVGILSTLKPCDQYTIEVADEPIMSKIDKGLVVHFYKFKQKSELILKVINVHLPLFMNPTTFGNGAYKRALNKLSHEVLSHRGPLLIAGDFNGWTPSRVRTLLPQFAKNNHLDELTFSTNSGNRAAMMYLDRVFTRGLKITSEETVTDIKDSDHFMRRIEISVESFFEQ